MSGGPEADDLENDARRVHFHGINDLATGWYVPRVVELANAFDGTLELVNIVDVLELHNVQQYLALGLLPRSLSDAERDRLTAVAVPMRSAIARFFASIDGTNFASRVAGVGYEYHGDLLELLGRGKVFERCDAENTFPILKLTGVHLGTMLANPKFVETYDAAVKAELLASPDNAEYLVRRYLEKGTGKTIHLPSSLTPADSRDLIERYIDSEEANLNHVRLIAKAREYPEVGIDAKLRLHAKRRSDVLNAKIFENNEGIRTGFELAIADDQAEAVLASVDKSDGIAWRTTYGRDWLESSLDEPSILNNFQHLFGFTDRHSILTFPAYPAGFGVMERVIGLTGNDEYKTGSAFNAINSTSFLQTAMYRNFLKGHDVELEDVLAWFCATYLTDEFGLANFSFNPSADGTSYLLRVRHLFAEMESLATQFALYVENGELDRELLSLGTDQVRYKSIPSMVGAKYVYSAGTAEIEGILHLLFSDQSSLTYIDENLKGSSAMRLLLKKRPAYGDFHEYQKPALDHLIELGILSNSGGQLTFVSAEQLVVLKALFDTQAASYYHLTEAGRAEVDAMVAKGWVVRESSLLTRAEADYFNFFLNRVDFSNGPNLRNSYLHGVQPATDTDDAHADTYIIALRMSIALAIKINDDLCLWDVETSGSSSDPDASHS
ncbi:MAG: hypothetical protein QM598_04180 [Protaetiibacter sp.]